MKGAHILGVLRGRPVSVFVLPGDSLSAYPHLREQLATKGNCHVCREGRYQMVALMRHGHVVVVLGEESPEVLTEVLLGDGSHASHA